MKHTTAAESRSAGTEIVMTASTKGTWVATVDGDQKGMIYDYKVAVDGGLHLETCLPRKVEKSGTSKKTCGLGFIPGTSVDLRANLREHRALYAHLPAVVSDAHSCGWGMKVADETNPHLPLRLAWKRLKH